MNVDLNEVQELQKRVAQHLMDSAAGRQTEMLAATIAAGFVAHGFHDGDGAATWDHTGIPRRAVGMALEIQAEVARRVKA